MTDLFNNDVEAETDLIDADKLDDLLREQAEEQEWDEYPGFEITVDVVDLTDEDYESEGDPDDFTNWDDPTDMYGDSEDY